MLDGIFFKIQGHVTQPPTDLTVKKKIIFKFSNLLNIILKKMQIGAKNNKEPYVQNVQIQSYDVSKIM